MPSTDNLSYKHYLLFYGLATIMVLSISQAFLLGKSFLIGIPIVLAGTLLTLVNFRFLYYVLVFSIPFSFSIYLGGNVFLEAPTEPLMVLFLFIVMYRPFVNKKWDLDFNLNPISIIIFAQLVWLIPVMLFSTDWILSLKYFLSKSWYLAAFMFGTGLIIVSFKDIKRLFWLIYSCLLLITLITTLRHASYGFSFAEMNAPLHPFFKNHVIYSSFIAAFIPFVWNARTWYNQGSTNRRWLNWSILFFLFCIGISYTRASWLSIPLAIGTFIIIRNNLMKTALIATGIGLTLTVGWLLYNYKYVEFAPEFEKTVYHRGNIEGHLSATYDGTDVSGMERVYRWIAAKNMILDKPITGFGTNCFYDNYRKYVVTSFETYVSDNPEKSTTHNYFLMVFAEQGVVGFILFIALLVTALVLAQRYYLRSGNKHHKGLLLACAMSLVIIIFHLFLNDLIETDKIGSIFYIALALIVKVMIWEKKGLKSELTAQ